MARRPKPTGYVLDWGQRSSRVAERQRAQEDAVAARLGPGLLTSRGGPSPERTAGEPARNTPVPSRELNFGSDLKLGAGRSTMVNIWNTTNIDENLGASVDNDGVDIQSAAPAQVFFGWGGVTPSAGRRHRLVMSTSDVTGSFTIVGRVNTGNVLVPETTITSNVTVEFDIPTADAETGWSFRSVSITTGRFECRLYDVTGSAPLSLSFSFTVGTNPSFNEIKGYMISGEPDGPYGAMVPGTLDGTGINRFQTNGGSKLVILSFGPAGAATVNKGDVMRVQIQGVAAVDLPWDGGLNRYQATRAATSDAITAADGQTVAVTVWPR